MSPAESLAWIAAGLAAGPGAVGIWLALNLWRRDVRIDCGAALHMRDLLELKARIARDVDGPRVLFCGLSNVMIGIRAEQIGEAIGARTVNLGVLANLTPTMVFEAILRTARGGDLVVLSCPYWFYQRETTIDHQAPHVKDLVFSYPTRAFFELPLRYQASFLVRQRPGHVASALARKGLCFAGAKSLPSGPAVLPHLRRDCDGGAFTQAGDYLGNYAGARSDAHVERVRAHPNRLHAYRVERRGETARGLRGFARAARERGVGLVAVWPAAYVGDDAAAFEARDAPIRKQIEALHDEVGIALLGDPAEFWYPLDAFFDSANHLTYEASVVYSARVAQLVGAVAEEVPMSATTDATMAAHDRASHRPSRIE